AVVAQKRSTWARWNLHSEAAAALTTVRFATAEDRLRVLDAVVDHATGASVLVTTPAVAHTPETFRRSDGISTFDARHGQVYTSHDVLAAEDFLLARVRATTSPVVDEQSRTASLERFNAAAAH